jgi:hypothetical protein
LILTKKYGLGSLHYIHGAIVFKTSSGHSDANIRGAVQWECKTERKPKVSIFLLFSNSWIHLAPQKGSYVTTVPNFGLLFSTVKSYASILTRKDWDRHILGDFCKSSSGHPDFRYSNSYILQMDPAMDK